MVDWDRQIGRALPFSVSVNLSAIQISRDDVARLVSEVLSESGLPGHRLTLELTESAIIQDPDRAARVLRALKRHQVKVAMDDFGTGYTSLALLQRLPIDILKIDRSLVSALGTDEDAEAIVRAILSLAAALGMETTAEGIEEAALGEAVAQMGCTYGQGFHYGYPMAAEAALAYWLDRHGLPRS
jgi:EAL domain-containing protein (putative c-di-GMP-specific phosphodiesterase class I)